MRFRSFRLLLPIEFIFPVFMISIPYYCFVNCLVWINYKAVMAYNWNNAFFPFRRSWVWFPDPWGKRNCVWKCNYFPDRNRIYFIWCTVWTLMYTDVSLPCWIYLHNFSNIVSENPEETHAQQWNVYGLIINENIYKLTAAIMGLVKKPAKMVCFKKKLKWLRFRSLLLIVQIINSFITLFITHHSH